jgi:hypothetical protein
MKDQEALLAEYTTLRAELIEYQQMNLQISFFTLPVAAVVIAYGFQQEYSFAFLAAIAILLAASWYSRSVLDRVSSTDAYIYATIEPKIESLHWETILAARGFAQKVRGLHIMSSIPQMVRLHDSALLFVLLQVF